MPTGPVIDWGEIVEAMDGDSLAKNAAPTKRRPTKFKLRHYPLAGRLVLDGFAIIFLCAMTLWPVRKVLTVLLAVLVTTGLSLSVAQASDMTVKMSMATEMSVPGHCDRHPCDVGDAGKVKAACAAVCGPVFATLPQAPSMAVAEMATILPLPNDELGRGTLPPPNRRPPRTF